MRHGLSGMAMVLVAGSAALGQSLNIEFGPSGAVPPSGYAAAGWPGVWNSFSSMPTNVRFPLVGLDGQAVGARLYNNGGTAILSHPLAGASGGDALLMGDMFLSFNNPVDLCLWIENMQAGTYRVYLYALTPNDPTLMSRVRVDFASPGATMIGGSWPGGHVQGITYQTFTVTVAAGGYIGLHSGLFGGNIQSGLNGVQVVRVPECYANCDESTAAPVLNVGDFACFLNAFASGHPRANCDGSTGTPALNVQDFACFLNAFAAGCT